jgi:hypothetical protein
MYLSQFRYKQICNRRQDSWDRGNNLSMPQFTGQTKFSGYTVTLQWLEFSLPSFQGQSYKELQELPRMGMCSYSAINDSFRHKYFEVRSLAWSIQAQTLGDTWYIVTECKWKFNLIYKMENRCLLESATSVWNEVIFKNTDTKVRHSSS